MQIDRILNDAASSAVIKNLATAFGVDPQRATPAIEIMMQALTDRIERNTLSRGGLADLLKALGSGHHVNYLDPNQIGSSPMVEDGNKILSHIIGSESRIDGVVAHAAADSGLSGTVLRTVLPTLAALVLGWLFNSGKGALGAVLNRLPRVNEGGGGMLPLPGSPGGSSLPRSASGGPLTIPDIKDINLPSGRGDNPYGDLGDVLRRQGDGSGGLAQVIRNILGGLLGFGNNGGIISWVIRFIVMRWGWTFLKFVLRRLFVGR